MGLRPLDTLDLAGLPNGAIDTLAPLAEPDLSTAAPCGHCGGFGKRLDPGSGELVICQTCGGTGVVKT